MTRDINNYYNETSNTIAGINTPPENEDISATDMVSGVVGEIMDNITEAFQGDAKGDHKGDRKEDHNKSASRKLQALTPNDQATPALDMIYGQSSPTTPDEEKANETGRRRDRAVDIEEFTVSPVSEEDTPVDPVSPPTDVVNGTDLLNGYSGEVDEDK